jgi:hypothetical protein
MKKIILLWTVCLLASCTKKDGIRLVCQVNPTQAAAFKAQTPLLLNGRAVGMVTAIKAGPGKSALFYGVLEFAGPAYYSKNTTFDFCSDFVMVSTPDEGGPCLANGDTVLVSPCLSRTMEKLIDAADANAPLVDSMLKVLLPGQRH